MSKTSYIKGLLLIVILAIIGATGVYSINSFSKSNKLLNQASSEASQAVNLKSSLPPLSATANWTAYNNQEGAFSLKYPTTWVQPANKKLCPSGTFDRSLYLGPNSVSVLKCATNITYYGQVSVVSYVGDQRQKYELNPSMYNSVTNQNAVVAGQEGQKTKGRIKATSKTPGSLPINTLVERYIFLVNSNTYIAQYIQTPSGSNPSTNVQTDFELMISRTLKFN